MASQEDMDSKSPKDFPDYITRRSWTVSTTLFLIMLAFWIPGLQLPKKQDLLAQPSYDMKVFGDFNDRAITVESLYYMLWCKGCDILKHPEYLEDRGRALRVLQKVKEREHDCRDMTWTTNDDPGPLKATDYISSTKSVAFVRIATGAPGSSKCSHKLGKYLAEIRGQSSGDIHAGLTSPLIVIESSFKAMTELLMHHQLILLPIMLLLMWNVCGGFWRSITSIFMSAWASAASQGFLIGLAAFFPDLELGFMAGGVQFVCLAFCTDYAIFFWTRFQKEREENPAKEMYLACVAEATRKSGEVIVCSTVVMIAAYSSTAFYPNLNDMGFMAQNFQYAAGLFFSGLFSIIVTPSWASNHPSLMDNREPHSPNCFQQCLPAMLTTLPEGKRFWKTWAGFVTRGKMMIVAPILAYGCLTPFIYCATLYEPNYNMIDLMKYDGIPASKAYDKLNDHFHASESVKWLYLLKATEIGPANNARMIWPDDVGAASTAEEVAFAQHAMKMSRKAHGNSFGDGVVLQPEFGKQVCKFSEKLQAVMTENHYMMSAEKIDTFWYGADKLGGGQAGCRSQEQISDGLKKAGTSFDSAYGYLVHQSGDKMILAFYPGLEIMAPRAQHLYHLLRDVLEKEINQEFVMNGKRYWFEAEHSSPISYMKETGVRMKRAAPWIIGTMAAIAFIGVAIMFKSCFLPLKFCFTIVIPIIAVLGMTIACYQENWFGFDDMANDGGVSFIIPYNQLGMLFGLAMDYDIFLFARVYEYRQEGYDNVSSVQKSLVETGPIVMTAGTFMCVSFFFMMNNPIMGMSQIGFFYFFGVFVDTFFTCTCIAPCVLCWGEWLNFFPGYIPPVTKKYNIDEGCDECCEAK